MFNVCDMIIACLISISVGAVAGIVIMGLASMESYNKGYADGLKKAEAIIDKDER